MLYILTGPNSFTKQQRIRSLVKDNDQVVEVRADEGVGRWFELVGQADLFGESAVLIGRDQFDEWSAKDKEGWRQYLRQRVDQSAETAVVLLYQKSMSEVADELAAWQGQGVTIEQFDSLSQAQMMQWLKQQAQSKNLTIENRWLLSLAQAFGHDQLAAEQQFEVWSLRGISQVGQVEILELGWVGDDSSVFDLTDSWARQQPALTIKHLHDLVEALTEVKQIIGMLGWQIEMLRAAQLWQATDRSNGPSLGKAFNAGAIHKAGRIVGRWNERRLMEAADQLIQLDTGSRNGEVKDVVTELELWIYRTTQAD